LVLRHPRAGRASRHPVPGPADHGRHRRGFAQARVAELPRSLRGPGQGGGARERSEVHPQRRPRSRLAQRRRQVRQPPEARTDPRLEARWRFEGTRPRITPDIPTRRYHRSILSAKPTPRPAPFTGFHPDGFEYFHDLHLDNSKAFWEVNRPRYEQHVREPLQALAAELSGTFGEAHIYRPYRDVRFSHDKRPYKERA